MAVNPKKKVVKKKPVGEKSVKKKTVTKKVKKKTPSPKTQAKKSSVLQRKNHLWTTSLQMEVQAHPRKAFFCSLLFSLDLQP